MPPDLPEQAIDTSVPEMSSPLGWGAFQATPEAKPPPRDLINYVVDTALGMAQGAVSIPAGLAGAATRIPGQSPEEMRSRRETQNFLQDVQSIIGRGKSQTGQYEDAHGGPDITTDPMHALTQGVAGIVPFAPVMLAGPGAIPIFGAQSVGEVANKANEYIRFADESELMKSPVYRDARRAGKTDDEAREVAYQATNDLVSNLAAFSGGALGGGLLTKLTGRLGSEFLSKAIGDRIMHGWKMRLGLGAAEGFGAGALMTGGTEYGTERALNVAGLGPTPDLGGIASSAGKAGLTLGIIGGAGKLAFGQRPAPPIGVEQRMAAQGYGPIGRAAGPPPRPGVGMEAGDLGIRDPSAPWGARPGPSEYGPEVEPRTPTPEMTADDLGPGAGRLDTSRGPMTAEDLGVVPPPGVMTPGDLGMGSEYGIEAPGRTIRPRPGMRGMKYADIMSEYGPEIEPPIPPYRGRRRPMEQGDIYGELGPEGPARPAVRGGAREMEPADIGVSEYGPEIPPRPPSPTGGGGGFGSRTARAEELRRARRTQMQPSDLGIGEYGAEIEPRGDVVQAGREMGPGDIYEPGSPEAGRARANEMLAELETLKRRRAYMERKGQTRGLGRLDDQISELRRQLIAHNRALKAGRKPPPPEAPPPGGGPTEPPPGGGGGGGEYGPEIAPRGESFPPTTRMSPRDLGLSGEVVPFTGDTTMAGLHRDLKSTDIGVGDRLVTPEGDSLFVRDVDWTRAREVADEQDNIVTGTPEDPLVTLEHMNSEGGSEGRYFMRFSELDRDLLPHVGVERLSDKGDRDAMHAGIERAKTIEHERGRQLGGEELEPEKPKTGEAGRDVLRRFGITPTEPRVRGKGGLEVEPPEAANVRVGEYGPEGRAQPALRGGAREMQPGDIGRKKLTARGTLTPGRAAEPIGPERRVGVTQGKTSTRPTVVEARRIGGRGAVVLDVARKRREAAEAEDAGPPVAVRAARAPSVEARTEEERRRAAAKEGLARRYAKEWEARAVANMFNILADHQAERKAEQSKVGRLVNRLVAEFRRISDVVHALVAGDIERLKEGLPFPTQVIRDGVAMPLNAEQQRIHDQIIAAREEAQSRMTAAERAEDIKKSDVERKAEIRARHYSYREGVAKDVLLNDPDAMQPHELSDLVAMALTQQPGEFKGRTARAKRMLREGYDPTGTDLEQQLRLFEASTDRLPMEHLRTIARDLVNEARARVAAGIKGYAELEKRMRDELGEAPQVRLEVRRRGSGLWHARFADYLKFIEEVEGIIGGTTKDGRTFEGTYDKSTKQSSRRAAFNRLRKGIIEFYEEEQLMRTGGIGVIRAARREALMAAKAQIERSLKTRGRKTSREQWYLDRAMEDIDAALAEHWTEIEAETVGRRHMDEAEQDAANAEQAMSEMFLQLERAANPAEFKTEGEARKANQSYKSMLYRFFSSVESEGFGGQPRVPDLLARIRNALDVAMGGELYDPQGRLIDASSLGSQHMRDARLRIINNWLNEYNERKAIDDGRLAGPRSRRARTQDELEREDPRFAAARENNTFLANHFGISYDEWVNLPLHYRTLSLEFNSLVRPKDVPEVTLTSIKREPVEGGGVLITGGGRADTARPPIQQTTTAGKEPSFQKVLGGEATYQQRIDRAQRDQARVSESFDQRKERLQREAQATAEREALANAPKMSLGDLYLPFQEQLEFIRRLQSGEGTEADLALRGQQLTDKMLRLRDALESIDHSLWSDPERAWAGERLQQTHGESRQRAGEVPEHPENVTPETVLKDFKRWSIELKNIEDEARLHYENLNPDVREMEYGVGNALDPGADLRKGGNLPRGAYVNTVSSFARESAVYGIQTTNRMVRHFLNMANKIVGDLDIVHLTDEQMMMALKEVGLPQDTPSFYHRPSDRIIIRQSALHGADRNQLLIHELAHPIMEAATQSAKMRPIINRLEQQRLALKNAFDENNHPQHAEVRRLLEGNDHGLLDVHEFFSELWANKDFAHALHVVETTAEQRDQWRTGPHATLLEAVQDEIKRGLTGMFFNVSKQRLLNDASIAGLDVLRHMEEGRPGIYDTGEGPVARAAKNWFNVPVKESGGAIRNVEVAKNPTYDEVMRIARESPEKGVRVLRGQTTGDVYAWDADAALHDDMYGPLGGLYSDHYVHHLFEIHKGRLVDSNDMRGDSPRPVAMSEARRLFTYYDNPFDMRKEEHRALYDKLRDESRKNPDTDYHLYKIHEMSMPDRGHAAMIADELRARGFDSIIRSEGSHIELHPLPGEPRDFALSTSQLGRMIGQNIRNAAKRAAERKLIAKGPAAERTASGERTVTDLLRRFDLDPTEEHQFLAENLKVFAHLVDDVRIRFVGPTEFRQYLRDSGTGSARGYFQEGQKPYIAVPTNVSAKVLVHELAHAATVRALNENPEFARSIYGIASRVMNDARFDRWKRQQGFKKGEFPNAYRNAKEFVAEFYSNREFRELTKQITLTQKEAAAFGKSFAGMKRPTLFRIVTDTIARFLRQMKGTANRISADQITGAMLRDLLNAQEKLSKVPFEKLKRAGVEDSAFPFVFDRGEPIDTGDISFSRTYGGSHPGRPAEGFVRDVWEGISERGKDIAHYVNQRGGPTGMIVSAANFADLARMGEARRPGGDVMQDHVQRIYNLANETLQRKQEIMEKEDHKHFRALAAELRIRSPGHLDDVLNYMDRENYVGAAGSSRIGEGENRWVSRDRDEPGHRQIHIEHPGLERAWNALPESSRTMIKDLRDYYKGRYDAVREATLRDLLHLRGFIEGNHAGATDAMVKLISEGRDGLSTAETDLLKSKVRGFDGYDKTAADRSADNNEFRDYLSEMRQIPEFRKIAGVYYPMMRRGDYVVEGHFKLDRFVVGGTERNREPGGPPTGNWEFPTKAEANAFIDRLGQDDAPFVKVQNVREITDDDGNTTGWMVNVNPLHLNFHSSLRKASEEHAALSNDPNIDVYSLQARLERGKYAMNPTWATALMKDMVESTKRTAAYRGLDATTQEILSKQWQDLAVRHLMSTSARSRYLPRQFTSGANKDALDNLMQYGNNTAHTLAELMMRPQMRDAVAGMDKYERDMRSAKDPELEQYGLRRSQVRNEVHRRLRMNNDHLQSPMLVKALQTVLKLSFLDKLMSPGFLLLNASEPWTIAAPMLAGEHGMKAYGEIAKAYNILGSGRIWYQGGADFAKVLKAGIHGDPQLADTVKLLSQKIKDTGFSDKWSSQKELLELFDYLQKHGYLDRNAGMELEQTLDPRAGPVGRGLNYLDNAFRQANIQVENVNRGVAGIAGYRLAKMKGKSHEEAMRAAQDIVDKSAGNYGYINAPEFFNHPHLKFAFQFKKYALRMTSNIIRVVAGSIRGEPHAMAQLVAMLASQQVISGFLGLPTEPFKAMITATNLVGLNPYNTDDVERILNERLAGILGRKGKDAFLYGLPRLLGTGFGSRTGWDTLWTYGTLGNKRDDIATAIGHLAGGAPGGMIAEWAQGGHDMSQGIASWMHGAHTQGAESMTNAARNLIPIKVAADAFSAFHDYFSGRQKPSGQPFDFKPTVLDTISRVGGVRTARDLAAQQARGAFIRQREVYNEDRSRVLQGYAQARTPAEQRAVRENILRSWNTGRPDVQKITIGDLQKAKIAFERKGKISPADLGLTITQRTRPFAPNPNVYGFMPEGA